MLLAPFKLERYFAKHEFTTRYLLCSSDCESLTIQELLALEAQAADRFHAQWLGYTESNGAASLRQEIAGIYSTIEPDQVLVHSGAEEAIFIFMHAALAPGDHVIVHSPCYQSLAEVANGIGCQVTRWEAREADGWSLDFNELGRLVRPNTRVVIVNTPHNPTGFLMGKADWKRLVEIAATRGIILFSDEVYRESEYDPQDRLTAACDMDSAAVSLGVMSKTYGLPGLRIGWISTRNAAIRGKMARLKDYTTICNSAPSEFLAELALRHRQELISRNMTIIQHNLEIVDGFFTRHRELFSWVRPRSGPIAFPRLNGVDVEPFCEDLVTRANVLLLPGTVFDDDGNHFRLGLGRKNLPEAVARLEAYLQNDAR